MNKSCYFCQYYKENDYSANQFTGVYICTHEKIQKFNSIECVEMTAVFCKFYNPDHHKSLDRIIGL